MNRKFWFYTVLILLLVLAACSSENQKTAKSTENEIATNVNFVPPAEITNDNTSLFADNGIGGISFGKIISGTIDKPQAATVLTDEECVMDEKGVTHCFNNIKLENGNEIRVNNLHVMEKVPCLSPDEKVQIELVDNHYAKITRNM